MSDTVLERQTQDDAKLGVVDCDIHPAFSTPGELLAYLPQRWRAHLADYGGRNASPLAGIVPYPRLTPGGGMRRDAWPEDGGLPASDLAMLRAQLLDPLDIEYGILQPLAAGSSTLNQELGAAMCAGVNDWQIDKWLGPEPRLKGSICVTQEDPPAALAEIEARVADKRFVQVAIPPRTIEPAGRRRYWPIYEAAAHYGLPIGMHSAASGVHTNSGTGWYSFYIEEHYAFAHALQSVLTSMIFEGVFDRFPTLKVVLVEGGFAWAAPLAWRLDRQFERMRSEVPHLKKKPSDYFKENIWFTTQPIEEPENNRHLLDTLRWIGTDRLMFSTDYPHWDFDDPRYAFKVPLTPAERAAIFRDNARGVYRLA